MKIRPSQCCTPCMKPQNYISYVSSNDIHNYSLSFQLVWDFVSSCVFSELDLYIIFFIIFYFSHLKKLTGEGVEGKESLTQYTLPCHMYVLLKCNLDQYRNNDVAIACYWTMCLMSRRCQVQLPYPSVEGDSPRGPEGGGGEGNSGEHDSLRMLRKSNHKPLQFMIMYWDSSQPLDLTPVLRSTIFHHL